MRWPGLARSRPLEEVVEAPDGVRSAIRVAEPPFDLGTGCVTCLESCWAAPASNGARPLARRLEAADLDAAPRFRVRPGALPGGGEQVVVVYAISPVYG